MTTLRKLLVEGKISPEYLKAQIAFIEHIKKRYSLPDNMSLSWSGRVAFWRGVERLAFRLWATHCAAQFRKDWDRAQQKIKNVRGL